jgi:hypothetical protein
VTAARIALGALLAVGMAAAVLLMTVVAVGMAG